MKTIYKYTIAKSFEIIGGNKIINELELPKDYKLLSIDMKGDELNLWAIVDHDETEMIKSVIYISGTGWPLPDEIVDDFTYIKTISLGDGLFIYHVFINKTH